MKPADRWLAAIAAAGIGSVGLALVSQHRFEMQPCPWCVLQRVFYLAMSLAALLGLVWRTPLGRRVAAALQWPLGLAGIAAALWQHYVAAASTSCARTLADRILNGMGLVDWLPEVFEPRASCADARADLLGVPYEFWSLALFALLMLAALRVWRSSRA